MAGLGMKLLERSWKERRTQIETQSAKSLPLMTGRKRRDNTTFEVLKTVKSIIKSV